MNDVPNAETPSAEHWHRARNEFPAAPSCVYLNTAARGLLGKRAAAAGKAYYDRLVNDPANAAWGSDLEAARESVARFLGVSPTALAFVANASTGINLAADLIAEPGDVLVQANEFPSVTLPWQQRGHRLVVVPPAPDGRVSVEDYARAMTPETRYLAVSAVQFMSGYLSDLAALRALCDERGLYLVVDATQAIGAVPLDLGAIRADVLVFSSYKWAGGGYGVAGMVVAPELLASRPLPAVGWRSTAGNDDLVNRDVDMVREAYALELGNPIMPGPLVLAEGLAGIERLGIEAVSTRLRGLGQRLIDGADRLGLEVRSPRDPATRGGIVMLDVGDAPACEAALRAAGVVVSARGGLLRVSPHFYNDESEVDEALAVLGAQVRQ